MLVSRQWWIERSVQALVKLLVVLLVVVIGLWVWSARSRAGTRSDPARPNPNSEGRSHEDAPTVPHRMVACAHCGLHLPSGDAVYDADTAYCSQRHQQAGPR